MRNDYCMPEVDASGELIIREGRHPVVEQTLSDIAFVPNDTQLNCEGNRVAIVTGPNMAGKSTYMRQTALITLMAQIGSFVPAKSAVIGVVDRVFTRIGASDDLASGQSTFMLEMSEVANILSHATGQSLLILDEIGRGTSTYDGMAIARAVLEYCADRKKLGAKTMFATLTRAGRARGQRRGRAQLFDKREKQGDSPCFPRQDRARRCPDDQLRPSRSQSSPEFRTRSFPRPRPISGSSRPMPRRPRRKSRKRTIR